MKNRNRKKQIVYVFNNRVIIKKEEDYLLLSIFAALFSNEIVLDIIKKELLNKDNEIKQYKLSSLQNKFGDRYEVVCNGEKYNFDGFLNRDIDAELVEVYLVWQHYMEDITKRGNLRSCINNLKKYRGTKILFKDFK